MANLDVDNVSINTIVLNEGGSAIDNVSINTIVLNEGGVNVDVVSMNIIALAADPTAGSPPFAGAFARHRKWAVGAFARRRLDRTIWSTD